MKDFPPDDCPEAEPAVTLSPQDADTVDALLDRRPEAPADDARRARVMAWLRTLGAAPMPQAPADLVQRTLETVQAERMRLPMQTHAAPVPRLRSHWRRRLAEIGAMAVAASLLVLVTLAGLGQAQRSRARIACMNNLRNVATAFQYYAFDYNAALPALAMPTNRNWLHGSGENAARNNAANLTPLLNGRYMPVAALVCPGLPLERSGPPEPSFDLTAIGYSYRNLYGSEPPFWDDQHETIILTDRNPVFAPDALRGIESRNSENHNRQGNHILRADASVTWDTHPFIGRDNDNIWTVNTGHSTGAKALQPRLYDGSELPASRYDIFVCP